MFHHKSSSKRDSWRPVSELSHEVCKRSKTTLRLPNNILLLILKLQNSTKLQARQKRLKPDCRRHALRAWMNMCEFISTEVIKQQIRAIALAPWGLQLADSKILGANSCSRLAIFPAAENTKPKGLIAVIITATNTNCWQDTAASAITCSPTHHT